ncbi:hypothetical protein BGW38_002286 [Lunasporangiospora selenospora]|uniref:Uncharacterized protein n=1 Tax=Lunasporangiospora selenospora TaxID=979761 RepID=A0A9P6KI58_9FUNG|nr:hypothetical protein BGW38_002286 [Lunasporangiospora selenospora]
MAPWVPFSECPETTSRSFKFLKHVPRGLVWAVTSSMNHIGSVILSSSNALSGTKAQLDDDFVAAESKRGKENSGRRRDIDGIEEFLDPYVVQFQEAFDKVLLPALAQDVNRQHSNGYNAEIQMCVADAGFDFADVKVPPGVDIYAYCGHLDTMVPIEASRELGHRCGWDMNEFKYTGHGGPRMLMTALEDYALAIAVTPRRPGSSKGHMRTGNGNAVAIEGTLSTDIVSDTVTVP